MATGVTVITDFKSILVLLCSFLLAVPAGAQDYSHCDNSDVKPSDHGTLTLGVSADSLERSENAAAINAAIAAAPAPGTVCLPNDSLYTTWDTTPNEDEGMVRITRDSISIVGAGACGWGDLDGCSFIGTPGNGNIADTLSAGNIGHKYPFFNESNENLYRGAGVTLEVDGETARDITLRGMKFSTGLEATGCFDETDTLENNIYCWGGFNKWFDTRNTNGDTKGLLVEDVQAEGYREEMFYHGGSEPLEVTARRIWMHESNASAWNVAAADSQVVRDSKFGPDVRFWEEMQAELYPNSYSLHENIEYVGCRVSGSRCIAMAADSPGNAVSGQVFNYRNNNIDLSGKSGIMLKNANYEFNFTNNTVAAGELFFRFEFGFAGAIADINIQNNTFDADGEPGVLLSMNTGGFDGQVSNNKLVGGRVADASGDGNMSRLRVAGNTFEGSGVTGFEGSAENEFFMPESANNIYTTDQDGYTEFWETGGELHPVFERIDPFGTSASGEYYTLQDTLAVQDQVIRIVEDSESSPVRLPADSAEHAWTSDISITGTEKPFLARFDSTNAVWRVHGWEFPADSLSEAAGWDNGSITGDSLYTGSGAAAGASQDNGYFRHREMSQDVSVSAKHGVKAEIDSVDQGNISPFGSAVVRLADADSTGATRIQVECARFKYCRVTWRKNGTLSKGNWQRIHPRFVRVLTDGTEAWVEHDNDLDGQWEGMPLDQDGYTTGDDRVTIDLSSTPHAGVGVVSQDSGTDMTAIIEDIGIISPN